MPGSTEKRTFSVCNGHLSALRVVWGDHLTIFLIKSSRESSSLTICWTSHSSNTAAFPEKFPAHVLGSRQLRQNINIYCSFGSPDVSKWRMLVAGEYPSSTCDWQIASKGTVDNIRNASTSAVPNWADASKLWNCIPWFGGSEDRLITSRTKGIFSGSRLHDADRWNKQGNGDNHEPRLSITKCTKNSMHQSNVSR